MTAIVEDFCITPAPLSWLLTQDKHVAGFLPCECEQVGLRAVHFFMWLSNYWEAISETVSLVTNPLDSHSEQVGEILGAYRAARADMRRYGLNQSNIAVAGAIVDMLFSDSSTLDQAAIHATHQSRPVRASH